MLKETYQGLPFPNPALPHSVPTASESCLCEITISTVDLDTLRWPSFLYAKVLQSYRGSGERKSVWRKEQ